jgi:hypothetical protein
MIQHAKITPCQALRDLLVGILNTRSFPSLQVAYIVENWQNVAESGNELPNKYFTGLGIMQLVFFNEKFIIKIMLNSAPIFDFDLI